jgi:hypothetical protein
VDKNLGEFINPSVYEMQVAVSKSYADVIKEGAKVELSNLEKTKNYQGIVARVNGSIDPTTQTITAFIDVKDRNLKEGMYLEANLNDENVDDAIEIDRNLLLGSQQIIYYNDSLLDVIDC